MTGEVPHLWKSADHRRWWERGATLEVETLEEERSVGPCLFAVACPGPCLFLQSCATRLTWFALHTFLFIWPHTTWLQLARAGLAMEHLFILLEGVRPQCLSVLVSTKTLWREIQNVRGRGYVSILKRGTGDAHLDFSNQVSYVSQCLFTTETFAAMIRPSVMWTLERMLSVKFSCFNLKR